MTKRTREPEKVKHRGGYSAGDPKLYRFVYDVVFYLFALCYLPVFFLRGKHRGGMGSRWGGIPSDVRALLAEKKVVWVHAVSVGEAVTAMRLVNALREELKDCRFLLTTTTRTGQEVAAKLKNDDDVLLYFPFDFRWAVRRFIRGAKPCAFVALETEIWPNVVFELSNIGVPLFIVNGRISDKALPQYRRVRPLMKTVLGRFSEILVQDAEIRGRFIEAGADALAVRVTGNMKFDWEPAPMASRDTERVMTYLKPQESFLFVAGSTHEGEEEVLFEAARALSRTIRGLKVVVAPRHPDRIESIRKNAAARGVETVRISEILQKGAAEFAGKNPVYLLDFMGALTDYYRYADAVFIGGSLVPMGGHNPVEPAFFEKPILFGPSMENFREMADAFRKADACREVRDGRELQIELERLAADPALRGSLGRSARGLVQKHQGATKECVERLLSALKN
jgi:3-deoxy-D-manno-octulosonic-acid transferase